MKSAALFAMLIFSLFATANGLVVKNTSDNCRVILLMAGVESGKISAAIKCGKVDFAYGVVTSNPELKTLLVAAKTTNSLVTFSASPELGSHTGRMILRTITLD